MPALYGKPTSINVRRYCGCARGWICLHHEPAPAGPAGHAEPQPAGAGAARWRLRTWESNSICRYLAARRTRGSAATCGAGVCGGAVDGLAGQRSQQCLAPRVHGACASIRTIRTMPAPGSLAQWNRLMGVLEAQLAPPMPMWRAAPSPLQISCWGCRPNAGAARRAQARAAPPRRMVRAPASSPVSPNTSTTAWRERWLPQLLVGVDPGRHG